MICIYVVEVRSGYAESLKNLRKVIIEFCLTAKIRYMTYAEKHGNKCRVYFFINDECFLKPAILLHFTKLYCPLSYAILHDCENEVCFVFKEDVCYKNTYCTYKPLDIVKKYTDNLKGAYGQICQFFSTNLIIKIK